MMKRIAALTLALLMIFTCAACDSTFQPNGTPTGVQSLDDQALSVLQQICGKKNSEEENARLLYDWVAENVQYRASTADVSGGFTDELIYELADQVLTKRRGACYEEAALMCVLLRRLGCEATVVKGEFYRAESDDWVDYAWVIAKVKGKYSHFDPLYGHFYAEENAAGYCMASDEYLAPSHRWEKSDYPACN